MHLKPEPNSELAKSRNAVYAQLGRLSIAKGRLYLTGVAHLDVLNAISLLEGAKAPRTLSETQLSEFATYIEKINNMSATSSLDESNISSEFADLLSTFKGKESELEAIVNNAVGGQECMASLVSIAKVKELMSGALKDEEELTAEPGPAATIQPEEIERMQAKEPQSPYRPDFN